MEWVESTGETIELAKEHALDRLGVHEDDAEFDVLCDVKTGVFGRIKEPARVRARVRPKTPRAKEGRGRRDRGNRRGRQGQGAGNRNGRQTGGVEDSGRRQKDRIPPTWDRSQKTSGKSSESQSSPKRTSRPIASNPVKTQKHSDQAKKHSKTQEKEGRNCERRPRNDAIATSKLTSQKSLSEDWPSGLVRRLTSKGRMLGATRSV